MKSSTLKKNKKTKLSLGELVASVSSYASSEREVLAAIHDLFRRGSVVAATNHGSKRLRLAS